MHANTVRWKTIMLTAVMMAAGVFIFSARSQPPARAQGEVTPVPPPYRSVQVTGAGSAEVTPDMAIVTLGVQTEAETAREALTQNNTQMESVLSTLSSAGIANADIRTVSIQLYPRYESGPRTQAGDSQVQLVGYTASNVVEVTVRDLNNLGSVLDEVVSAGGNQIQGIRFDVSNQTEALDQAREAAMQDATRKAQQLVDLAGATLGPVITIVEDSRVPQPFASSDMRLAEASVPVSPGTQSIIVQLQVTWELQ
jgi:uncharacterized protein